MRDSIVVPVYIAEMAPSKVVVPVDESRVALCTRVQSVPHDFFGEPVGRCGDDVWVRVRVGVRAFLDIDRRVAKLPPTASGLLREDWWPRQHAVHFAGNPDIGPDDKLYAVVADDDWNGAPGTSYTAAVRLTSRTKAQRRRRWEVPVGDGWVVSGDLYSVAYSRFEQTPPRGRYPKRVSADEGAGIATRQQTTLNLR